MPVVGEVKTILREVDVEWKIKEFSSFLKEDGKWLWSPLFSFKGEDWNLGIYPESSHSESFEFINLYLIRLSAGSPVRVDFSIALKTLNEQTVLERHCTKVFVDIEDSHDLFQFVSRSELLRRQSDLLPSDVLTVLFILNNPKSDESASKAGASGYCTSPHEKKLHDDFKELFLKKEDCDVIVKVKDSEIPAHRVILKARSPVFASTFRHEMKENATGIVEIEDCDPSAFSDFLRFIYCGDVEMISQENVFSLFTLADKYEVMDLRAKCLDFIKKNLAVDTFCETLTLALQHSETEVITLATDFFVENAEEILLTVKWQTFAAENPTQSNELVIKFVRSVKH